MNTDTKFILLVGLALTAIVTTYVTVTVKSHKIYKEQMVNILKGEA